MKKTMVVILTSLMVLTGCRTNGRQIDANYDINEYKDYMTTDDKVDQLNYLMTSDEKDLSLLGNLMDGLVETDKYGNLKPAIGQDIGLSSENDKIWEFSIHDDIPWVNALGEETGAFVTADDFVCGIQYVLDHKESPYHEEVASLLLNGKEYAEGKVNFGDVGVDAVNNYTVRYTLKEACSYFNTYLLNGGFYPVNRSLLNDMGDNFATSPSMMWYNGAYYLETVSENKITFKKNTHYWDVGQVSFESGSITLVEDNEEALDLFKKGKLSYAYIDAEYAEINKDDIDSHMYMSAISPEVYVYVFNFDVKDANLQEALKNENFRKAILKGMDVQSSFIVKDEEDNDKTTSTSQNSSAQSTVIPSEFVTTNDGIDYLSLGSLANISSSSNFNLADCQSYASQAMHELQGKVTFPVEISVPVTIDHAVASNEFSRVVGNFDQNFVVFKEIPYTEDSDNKEVASFKKVLSENTYGMARLSINAQNGDPTTYLSNFLSTDIFNTTYSDMNDKVYDALYAAANMISLYDDRLRAFAEVESYLINKGYVVPFAHGQQSYKVSSINDYSLPRGTYGLSRFKLKGVKATENAITITERAEMKIAYEEAKRGAL